MVRKIIFPENQGYRYYPLHYSYILESIKHAGIQVEVSKTMKQLNGHSFEICVDDTPVVMDFYDHTGINEEARDAYPFYFKFHYTKGIHSKKDGIYSIPPISFHNWAQYEQIRQQVRYTANNDVILNNQRAYNGHVKYRTIIQQQLSQQYPGKFDMSITDQVTFWKKANHCLVSVCVPGARENMLDRGQIQYMALGVCTISPELITMLPNFTELIPGEHYIACKLDYSDLIEKIEWCKNNRNECIRIGQNAKELFETWCTPVSMWEWVEQAMHGKTVTHRA